MRRSRHRSCKDSGVLDLGKPAADLTADVVDVESVSGDERALADLVEQALTQAGGLQVERDGNVVLARTVRSHDELVCLAGHLDTVPIALNLPSRNDGERLWGCGTSDMKSGVAVALRVAHLVATGAISPTVDLSWVFYDCEEIAAARNGLGRLARERPDVLQADLAVLLEPTNALVEGGCQGTLRTEVTTTGRRAHAARSWLGVNAIHAAVPVLERLAAYESRSVEIDGLRYREGLNAVAISGGVAGNVVPDLCTVTVNFRFAPDRTVADAKAFVHDQFAGFAVEVVDWAPAAPPGLDAPIAARMLAAVGAAPLAKLGWTDVARFAELGIPALNFGPGDPELAHTREEHVVLARIADAEAALIRFLTQ
jgi:succinyl-diaminopimelate desuccinylase